MHVLLEKWLLFLFPLNPLNTYFHLPGFGPVETLFWWFTSIDFTCFWIMQYCVLYSRYFIVSTHIKFYFLHGIQRFQKMKLKIACKMQFRKNLPLLVMYVLYDEIIINYAFWYCLLELVNDKIMGCVWNHVLLHIAVTSWFSSLWFCKMSLVKDNSRMID